MAKKLADEGVNVRFAVSNMDEFRHELTQFGIKDAKKDAKYVLARGARDEKFKLTDDFRFDGMCWVTLVGT